MTQVFTVYSSFSKMGACEMSGDCQILKKYKYKSDLLRKKIGNCEWRYWPNWQIGRIGRNGLIGRIGQIGNSQIGRSANWQIDKLANWQFCLSNCPRQDRGCTYYSCLGYLGQPYTALRHSAATAQRHSV
jgi:hypothetical protein